MPQVFRAANLLDTFGINTHIPYTDGGYANISRVLAELNYLGINQVRDGLSNGEAGSAPLSSFIRLGQAGIQFTTLVDGDFSTTAALQARLNLIETLNTTVAGSVVAVEGSNEINNWPIVFNGVGGLQGAVNLQQTLYSLVHSDRVLQNVGVDYFTGYGGDVGIGPNPSTTAGLADYDNQHPYPVWGQAPALRMNPSNVLSNEGNTTGPVVYTETGYSTLGSGSVSDDVQAKYTLDLLLDAAIDGVSRTYLYQLMDAYAPNSSQGDDGFGLFNQDGTPKEAATAIHNLTSLLRDTSTNATTFSTGSRSYTIAGLPSSGRSLEVAKSDGTFDVVVWNEPQIWDASSNVEIGAPVAAVTVRFEGPSENLTVFDPLVSASPLQSLPRADSIQLSVSDHPIVVQVRPSQVNTIDDFNGDGTSDILFSNKSTGDLQVAQMSNGVVHSWNDLGAPSAAYQIAGTGTFEGGATSDILFRNSATGDIGFGIINGDSFQSWVDIGSPLIAYSVVGVGDFNGDGTSDVLFRDNSTGDTGFGQINNSSLQAWHDIGTSSTDYSVVGVGDFNGDGVSDVVFRDAATRDWGIALLGNGTVQSWQSFGSSALGYSIDAIGDFNGDGVSDVLFRNEATGDTGYYSPTGPSQGWHDLGAILIGAAVVGAGDYNGDGNSDILFRDNSTGVVSLYETAGASIGVHTIGSSNYAVPAT